MDSDTYESLHILVGKFIQSQERKKIKHGRRKDRYVPTQLEAIRATSHKDFPSANNNTELPKKEVRFLQSVNNFFLTEVPQNILHQIFFG